MAEDKDIEKNTQETEDNQDKAVSVLKEAIKEQAIEEEKPQSSNFTLRKILGGDFLSSEMLKKQLWVILLIVMFTLVYVSNRYSCQKDLLKINELNIKLEDAKYKALASSSQLTELCRESNVLNILKNNNDSTLHIATQPPFIIEVPANK
ncbi:MAG: FtsL-like putative cell division protein [Prevotella sp.]